MVTLISQITTNCAAVLLCVCAYVCLSATLESLGWGKGFNEIKRLCKGREEQREEKKEVERPETEAAGS